MALKELLQAQHAEFGVRLLEGRVGAELRAPNVFDSGLAHDGRGSMLTVEPVGGGPALGEVNPLWHGCFGLGNSVTVKIGTCRLRIKRAQRLASCRSRQMLNNESVLTKIGRDIADIQSFKVS